MMKIAYIKALEIKDKFPEVVPTAQPLQIRRNCDLVPIYLQRAHSEHPSAPLNLFLPAPIYERLIAYFAKR